MPAPDGHTETFPHDPVQMAALIEGFEDGSLPKTQWTHAAHLVVGTHYLYALGFNGALETMRLRVRAYNAAVGTPNTDTSGYHETLTRMWLLVLDRLREKHSGISELELARLAVQRFGHQSGLHRALYHRDVVKNTAARRDWVEPDLPIESIG
jgi:hypothetical protein